MFKKGLSSFLLSIGLLVHVPFCSSGDPCPPNEELKVCSCRHVEASSSGELPYTHRDILKDENGTALELDNPLFFTIIDCNKSSNILELEEDITLGLDRKKIDKLTLREIPAERDHVLANLPMGFLRNTRVQFIMVQDSKLSGDFLMEDFPFGGQEQSLVMLSINKCSLYGALTYDVPGTVNTKNLENLLSLEMLDLSNNYLTVITSSAFEVTSNNISILHLGLNSIKKIEPLAFRGLPNLKGISLRNNCLRSLDRIIFPDTMELLETIDLGQNYLHAVQSNLFTNMPALTTVSLSGNFLHSLPEKSWKQIWSQLKYIDLEVFLFCLSLSNAGGPCPTGDDNKLKICECSQKDKLTDAPFGVLSADYKFTILECKEVKSFTDLEQDLSKFNRQVIDVLILRNIAPENGRKLAKLPSSLPKNIKIRSIEIRDSQIFGDFLGQGNSLEEQASSLVSLAVKNCSLQGALTYDTLGTVNTKNLDKLTKVNTVDFSNNYLTVIYSTAFLKPPKNLISIDLSKNEIYLVQPGAFGAVLNLKSINLANNYIESIDRSIFATPAKALETIDLGTNSLKTLPPTFFNIMPVLKKVVLENNYLHSMPEKPWNSFWPTMTTLDVSGNNIECDCSLAWLPKMNKTGKTISGKCVADELPFGVTFEHELQTLKQEQLIC